jgi:hypothetical protein
MREQHVHLYMYTVYVLTMNTNFVIIQYILPALLTLSELFFYGFKSGWLSNEQVTFTCLMIIQLGPI